MAKQEMYGPPPVPAPRDAIVLRQHWNYTIKGDGTRKARNCCDGSPWAAPQLKLANTYSSCIKQPCMRLFFALCAHKGYTSLKVDATNAYANSPPPHQPTFVAIDDRYAGWNLARHGIVFLVAWYSQYNMLFKDILNPAHESIKVYQQSMQQYYAEHRMIERIHHLETSMHEMTQPEIRNELEKWDADQGRAMLLAEKQLSRPRKPYQWSPMLRNAGLINRYWRLRLREQLHKEDFGATFRREVGRLSPSSLARCILCAEEFGW